MTKEELEKLATNYAKGMVTAKTGFEVGSGQWRSKVNMNSSSFEEGFMKALELVANREDMKAHYSILHSSDDIMEELSIDY